MTARQFANCILTLALRFRFSVTSWGRSAPHNQLVGGLPDSFHLDFRAVDVELDPKQDRAAFIKRAGQLGLEVTTEGGYLHLEPRF